MRYSNWSHGLHGLDALSDRDHAEALVDYLGLSETQLATSIEKMVRDGKHELAAELLRWALARYPASQTLQQDRSLVYAKLMEKYQAFDPFRFIVYAGQGGQTLTRLDPQAAPASASAR